jgi:hypothetical protein
MKWRCVEVGGPEIRGVTEISEFGGANPGLVHFRVDYVSPRLQLPSLHHPNILRHPSFRAPRGFLGVRR